jgi:hypothetical protein
MTVLGLPRLLHLTAPSGTAATFDLSGDDESLDLSLSPAVIAWIEEHFQMRKLRTDYPHWDDAAPALSVQGGTASPG